MRIVHAALLLAVSASPALAQRAPAIVIPGRPDIPVLMNGVDVSYDVIEGDFGLDRPGEMPPTVIYRLQPIAVPYWRGALRVGPGYYPKSGKQPGYGRLEIIPPADRPLPPPAPSYRKSWSSQSDSAAPVTEYAPFPVPPIGVGISIDGGPNGRNGRNDHHGGHGGDQGAGQGGAQGGAQGGRPGGDQDGRQGSNQGGWQGGDQNGGQAASRASGNGRK